MEKLLTIEGTYDFVKNNPDMPLDELVKIIPDSLAEFLLKFMLTENPINKQ